MFSEIALTRYYPAQVEQITIGSYDSSLLA